VAVSVVVVSSVVVSGVTVVVVVVMLLESEINYKYYMNNKYVLHKRRAHVNIFTCTVCQMAVSWPHKLIDIIISWTGF